MDESLRYVYVIKSKEYLLIKGFSWYGGFVKNLDHTYPSEIFVTFSEDSAKKKLDYIRKLKNDIKKEIEQDREIMRKFPERKADCEEWIESYERTLTQIDEAEILKVELK